MRHLARCWLAGLVCLSACAPAAEGEHWQDQPSPSGPCYEANLLDGLSEESTDELHATYDCVNRTGLLGPLSRLVDAMDSPTRTGDPSGVELARIVNGLARADVDLLGLAGLGVELLDADGEPVRALAEVSVELLYGTSYERVVAGDVSLQAGSSLDAGLLRPLLPGVRDAAAVVLDGDLKAATLLGEVLSSETLVSAAHTASAMTESSSTSAVLEDLPLHLGQALEAVNSPGNDRWSDASGDSLRDLSEKLLVETGNDGRVALEHLADPLRVMLADDALQRRVEGALIRLEQDDHLRNLPPQVLYLASVDADGGSLSRGEDSALVSLLRLVHDANTPMVCSLDLWVTELEVDLGNLSVALLEELAQQDPSTVEGGVDLLGTVIGWSLSQSVLNSVADSGVCPVLDRQMVSDLDAFDRLNDPAAGDLLVVLLDLLEAIYDRNDSRVPELVDALSTTHAFGATYPIEELIRDVITGGLVSDALELVDVVLHPTDHLDTSGFPTGVQPLDFDALWGILEQAFTPRNSGLTAVEELAPALQAMLLRDTTWQAIDNAGALMLRADSRVSTAAQLLPEVLALDPELSAVQSSSPLFADPELAGPLLRIVENNDVIDAAAEAEVTTEGPMAWYARLVVSGTLDAALAWVDWTLSLLRSQ